ncbi:MAG: ABC transporter permease, partial [Bacilli bacterium]|nr:ABC transporter permease [Bacilli bacterium]
IFILYSLMVNVLYKSLGNDELNSSSSNYTEIDIEEIEEENASLDLTKEEDLETYVMNISLLELNDYQNKYSSNNERYLLDNYIYDLIVAKNEAKHITNDETEYENLNNEINTLLEPIKKDDWEYFVKKNIAELQELITTSPDNVAITRYQARLKLNEYRLNNSIPYDYANYLNNALEFIETNLYEYQNLASKESLNKKEQERFDYLKEEMLTNEYILKNKTDVNNAWNLHSLLMDFASEYGLFILIFIIYISGSIVSEEFNKGTIKYLLTKPYKRRTILTSKYLTILILIPCIIIGMYLTNLLIGSLILGYNSLSIPVLLYDNVSAKLISVNTFVYSLKLIVSVLPMYLVLATFCFALSAITTSTSSAVTLTFAFYLVGNVISSLYLSYGIKAFKGFVSLHWDFSYLVNLSANIYNIKPFISILVIIIYLSVMLCLS